MRLVFERRRRGVHRRAEDAREGAADAPRRLHVQELALRQELLRVLPQRYETTRLGPLWKRHDRDPTHRSPRAPLPLLTGVGCNEKCTCRNCENPCGAVKRETKVKLNPNERKAAKAAAAIAAAAEQAAIPGRRPAELDGGGTVGDMALRHSSSFGDMAPAPPPADPLGFAPSTQPRPPPSGLPTQLRTAPSAASLGAATPPMAPPVKPPAERPAPQ